MKEVEFEIVFESRDRVWLAKRKKSSPDKRKNRSVFCIQIDQILRNKLERQNFFFLPSFAISIKVNKNLFSYPVPTNLPGIGQGELCLTCPPGGRATASAASALSAIREKGTRI